MGYSMIITVHGNQVNLSLAKTELLLLSTICRIATDNLKNFDDTNLRNYALELASKLNQSRIGAEDNATKI